MPMLGLVLALATLPKAVLALKRGEEDRVGAVDQVLRGEGLVVEGAA